jgi:hypothetical protein
MSAQAAMRRAHDEGVPAFLCIDVEPDEFALPEHGPASWAGYADMMRFVARLRSSLASVATVSPRFCWTLRMDRQVAATSGAAGYTVEAFTDDITTLTEAGDAFGLHVHPLRWSEPLGTWFHDFADSRWIAECVEESFASYSSVFGASPAIHRFGARFLSDDLVGLLERLGFRVDLTLEPGYGSPRGAPHQVPMTGTLPNWIRARRVPYRPRQCDYRRADHRSGRDIVIVPLTSARTRFEKPRLWRAARAIRRGFRSRPLPLNPWREWPSAQYYWDLVAAELDAMPKPYLALVVRTDHPESAPARRARLLLEHLPHHPIASRLRFVDPVNEVPALCSLARRDTVAAHQNANAGTGGPYGLTW